MDEAELLKRWEDFKKTYSFEEKTKIWTEKSNQFKLFWKERLLNDNIKNLNQEEVDDIIRILDRNAKGNTRENESVARVMIAQGAWRRMFNEIKSNNTLKELIFNILNMNDEEKIIFDINRLYELNKGKKNFLTGENANAINAMLFAYNPTMYISVVSLSHRKKIIDYFDFENKIDFENDLSGKKIINSNQIILSGFKTFGIDSNPRAISDFLYLNIKDLWDKNSELKEDEELEEIPQDKMEYLEEKHYQKLIHRNFKKIFPDLEYYDQESQNSHEGHYTSEVGKMDFLAKDKKGDFVVIELKLEGSDQSLGQICRYMGWVKETLCEGNQQVKGVIISENNDNQLNYAIKVVPNVTFKKMWLEVKIVDFN